MPIERVKITIPLPDALGGPTDVQLGRWVWSCKPATSEFRPTNLALFEGELEISLEKVQKAAGLLGKLVNDKQLNEFIKQTKELVPQATAYFNINLLPEAYKTPCPTDETCATTVGFSLKIQFVGRVRAAAGVVGGGARVAIAVELAGDDKECDCCRQESSNVMLAPDDQEMLLPPSDTSEVAATSEFASRPAKSRRTATRPEGRDQTAQEEARLDRNEQLATVTAMDMETGEVRTLGRIPFKV